MSRSAAPQVIQLIRMHSGQEDIVRLLDTQGVQYVSVACGRRFGKTIIGANWLFREACNTSGLNCHWVSRWTSQSNKVFRDMQKAFAGCAAITAVRRTEKIIEFYNGSQIQFFTAENHDVIRGEGANRGVYDEFALYSQEAWEESIQPTLSTDPNAKALLISSPKGFNIFKKLYDKGLDPDNRRHRSYHAPSWKNPLVSLDFIADVKKQVPEWTFRQEYAAEFVEDAGSLFRNVGKCVTPHPHLTGNYYAGLDIGQTNDYTVLTVLNEFGQMVYFDRFNLDELKPMAKRIAKVLLHLGVRHTYVEVNTYQGMADMLKECGVRNITSVFVGSKEFGKKELVDDLIVAFQEQEVGILPVPVLQAELEVYTFTFSKATRTVKYGAPSGYHDDCVMSLAHAWRCLKDKGGRRTKVSVLRRA